MLYGCATLLKIHSSINGHLVLSPLAIMVKDAMNIRVQVSVWIDVFIYLGNTATSGIAGLYSN